MYRNRRRHLQEEHENLDRWLISYADYMTLMFAFFVVLYAFMLLKQEQLQELSVEMERIFRLEQQGPPRGASLIEGEVPPSDELLDGEGLAEQRGSKLVDDQSALANIDREQLGMPLSTINSQLRDSLFELEQQGLLAISEEDDWVTLDMSSGLLFGSGSATVTAGARLVMAEVARVLAGNNNFVRVRGYTDDQPIENELFTSNWELSAARSAAVLRTLQGPLAPQRLAIEAYGAYRPVVANEDETSRARNRRVVVAVSKFAWQPPAATSAAVAVSDAAPAAPVAAPLSTLPPGAVEEAVLENGIRIIRLPHGGIRITTREESPPP